MAGPLGKELADWPRGHAPFRRLSRFSNGDSSRSSPRLPALASPFHLIYRLSLQVVEGEVPLSSNSRVRRRYQPSSLRSRAKCYRLIAGGGIEDVSIMGRDLGNSLWPRKERVDLL
jgi:hypothetical protein